MKSIFDKPLASLADLRHLSKNELVFKALPYMLLEIMNKYFRLELQGSEHLPKKGRAIILPNHSGYSGFDAFMLGHEVYKATQRVPQVMTHPFWFLTPATAIPAHRLGFLEATTENGFKILSKDQLLVLFPEGEMGNFKETAQRYQLQEFKRGFVRLALRTQAPIIPTLILGAEETHINLKQIQFSKFLRGTVLPLPLNLIPLPAKWKIVFYPPIHLPYQPESADDRELVHDLCEDIQEDMQQKINLHLGRRKAVFT